MIQPAYTRIQQLLSRAHSLTDAAEAHGTLAGCLCGASGYRFEDWLLEILPEGGADRAAREALQELFERHRRRPERSRRWSSSRCCPTTSEPIAQRTAGPGRMVPGLPVWPRHRRIPDASELPGEVGEIVRDLTEITRADVDEGQDVEANESAYAELVEFVRVGVQLLFEELAGCARRGPAAARLASRLH